MNHQLIQSIRQYPSLAVNKKVFRFDMESARNEKN